MQSRRSYGRFSDVAILNKKNGSQMLELGLSLERRMNRIKSSAEASTHSAKLLVPDCREVHVVANL